MPLDIHQLQILCGPMLRRVTSQSVHVFVALNQPRAVQLSLHDGAGAENPPELYQSTPSDTIPLGAHLHVALVTLTLPGPEALVPGKLYGYNLHFRESDNGAAPAVDLKELNLLSDEEKYIGCAFNKLPAFSLPPHDFSQLNIVHGSCRKPHGEGKDMLAGLDTLLENLEQYEDPLARPHLLLLTGDQIYADDVAPPLLRALHDTARDLLGWREVFSATAVPGDVADLAKAYREGLPPKNEAIDAILAEALDNNFADATIDAVIAYLQGFKAQLIDPIANSTFNEEDFKSLDDGGFSGLPHINPLHVPDNYFSGTSYYVEYVRVKKILKDKLPGEINRWENINRSNTSFLADTLKAYVQWQKGTEGIMEFFEPLASDRHWGHTAVEQAGEQIAGTADTLPQEEPQRTEKKHEVARSQLPIRPLVLSRLAPPLRGEELKYNVLAGIGGGMTSDAMDAHLLFLSEFYLMYLFSWSDVLWPVDEYGDITLPYFWEAVPNYALFGANSRHDLMQLRLKTLAFAKSLPKVRRVLANIPTLMIFDDHEVTDDWNLNEDWVLRVNDPARSPLGATLLRNALAAYAVFQDWGNRPEDYRPGMPGAVILDQLRYGVQGNASDMRPPLVDGQFNSTDGLLEVFRLGSHAFRADTQRVVGGDALKAQFDQTTTIKRWEWQYRPYGEDSAFTVFALDTRTWRGFPDESYEINYVQHLKGVYDQLTTLNFDFSQEQFITRKGPAALIAGSVLEAQLAGLQENHLNLVISPAPVFGLPLLEDGVQRLAAIAGSTEGADFEAWSGNRAGFEQFIGQLSHKTVVLLSGDVHYAYSNYLDLPQGDDHTRILQLCSSSMKNETLLTEYLGLAGRSNTLVEFMEKPGEMTAADWGKILPIMGEKIHDMDMSLSSSVSNFGTWFGETAPISPSYNPMDSTLYLNYLLYKDYELLNVGDLLFYGAWQMGPPLASYVWRDFMLGSVDTLLQRSGSGLEVPELLYDKPRHTVYFLRDEVRLHQYTEADPDTPFLLSGHRQETLEKINDRDDTVILDQQYESLWDEMREVVGFNNIGRLHFRVSDNDPSRLEQLTHRLYWLLHKDAEPLDLFSLTDHQVDLGLGVDYWTHVRRTLVQLAEAEYRWWNPGASPKIYDQIEGQKNPRAHARLELYYRTSGLYAKYLTAPDPDHPVWGSVFLSYLLKAAGHRDKLPLSERTIDLMRAAKENRLDQLADHPFWLYDIDEYAPQPGDILCHWRQQAFSYDDIDPADALSPRPAHGQVVTFVQDQQLLCIGGKLQDSVGKLMIALDDEGKIPPGTPASSQWPGDYNAIIRIGTQL